MKHSIILLIFLPILLLANGKVLNYTKVGCRVAGNGEFPHQVSIHLAYGDYEFICGGTLISENIVLTTAHSMYYSWGGVMPPIIVNVFTGRSDLKQSPSKVFAVNKISFHPAFDPMQMKYDIALIELKAMFPRASAVLSLYNPIEKVQIQYKCQIIGWNLSSNDLNVYEVDIIKCDGIIENETCTQSKLREENLSHLSPGSALFCDNKLVGILPVAPEVNSTCIFENLEHSKYWLNRYTGISSKSTQSRKKTALFLLPSLAILFIVITFITRQ